MSYTPGSSPPLHHPVPQHPIQFRNSPGPYNAYQNYQPQQQPGMAPGPQPHPQGAPGSSYGPDGQIPFGLDSIFQGSSSQLGIQVGRSAINYGQEYIGKNVETYVNVGVLRYYFQVSNSYVLRKVMLVLFPWTHKPWSRQFQRTGTGAVDGFALPRDDINAPDMYIPTVALTTWLVLFSAAKGLVGEFETQLLGVLASKALAIIFIELIFLKIFTYLLAASSRLLDFVAYSGYKFIPVTLVTLASALSSNRWVKWSVFAYSATATAFFMLRSLRYDLLSETSVSPSTVNSAQRQRRIQFLFVYAVICQYFLMWLLV